MNEKLREASKNQIRTYIQSNHPEFGKPEFVEMVCAQLNDAKNMSEVSKLTKELKASLPEKFKAYTEEKMKSQQDGWKPLLRQHYPDHDKLAGDRYLLFLDHVVKNDNTGNKSKEINDVLTKTIEKRTPPFWFEFQRTELDKELFERLERIRREPRFIQYAENRNATYEKMKGAQADFNKFSENQQKEFQNRMKMLSSLKSVIEVVNKQLYSVFKDTKWRTLFEFFEKDFENFKKQKDSAGTQQQGSREESHDAGPPRDQSMMKDSRLPPNKTPMGYPQQQPTGQMPPMGSQGSQQVPPTYQRQNTGGHPYQMMGQQPDPQSMKTKEQQYQSHMQSQQSQPHMPSQSHLHAQPNQAHMQSQQQYQPHMGSQSSQPHPQSHSQTQQTQPHLHQQSQMPHHQQQYQQQQQQQHSQHPQQQPNTHQNPSSNYYMQQQQQQQHPQYSHHTQPIRESAKPLLQPTQQQPSHSSVDQSSHSSMYQQPPLGSSQHTQHGQHNQHNQHASHQQYQQHQYQSGSQQSSHISPYQQQQHNPQASAPSQTPTQTQPTQLTSQNLHQQSMLQGSIGKSPHQFPIQSPTQQMPNRGTPQQAQKMPPVSQPTSSIHPSSTAHPGTIGQSNQPIPQKGTHPNKSQLQAQMQSQHFGPGKPQHITGQTAQPGAQPSQHLPSPGQHQPRTQYPAGFNPQYISQSQTQQPPTQPSTQPQSQAPTQASTPLHSYNHAPVQQQPQTQPHPIHGMPNTHGQSLSANPLHPQSLGTATQHTQHTQQQHANPTVPSINPLTHPSSQAQTHTPSMHASHTNPQSMHQAKLQQMQMLNQTQPPTQTQAQPTSQPQPHGTTQPQPTTHHQTSQPQTQPPMGGTPTPKSGPQNGKVEKKRKNIEKEKFAPLNFDGVSTDDLDRKLFEVSRRFKHPFGNPEVVEKFMRNLSELEQEEPELGKIEKKQKLNPPVEKEINMLAENKKNSNSMMIEEPAPQYAPPVNPFENEINEIKRDPRFMVEDKGNHAHPSFDLVIYKKIDGGRVSLDKIVIKLEKDAHTKIKILEMANLQDFFLGYHNSLEEALRNGKLKRVLELWLDFIEKSTMKANAKLSEFEEIFGW